MVSTVEVGLGAISAGFMLNVLNDPRGEADSIAFLYIYISLLEFVCVA